MNTLGYLTLNETAVIFKVKNVGLVPRTSLKSNMEQKELKSRKQIHLEDFNYSSHEHSFFVTLCTADKQPHFNNPKIVKNIIDDLEYRRMSNEIKLFCYCIMPDHLHLIFSLNEAYTKKTGAFGERTLQNWVSAFKRYTAKIIKEMFDVKQFWQPIFMTMLLEKMNHSLESVCIY